MIGASFLQMTSRRKCQKVIFFLKEPLRSFWDNNACYSTFIDFSNIIDFCKSYEKIPLSD